jgi:hypothetical protein
MNRHVTVMKCSRPYKTRANFQGTHYINILLRSLKIAADALEAKQRILVVKKLNDKRNQMVKLSPLLQ